MSPGARARDFRPPLLALRALGLGDLLVSVPALRGLRAAHPECRMVLACPAALHQLAHATGAVDEALDVPGLVPFRSRLPPALAVNLHGCGPQSHRLLLAQRPLAFIAFRHRMVPESAAMPEWRDDERESHRWCRLLTSSGIAADPDDLDLEPSSFGAAPARLHGATVIHPGAGAPARRWPVARFAEVARSEAHAGHTVVITGSASERARCRAVARRAGLDPSCVLAGTTTIRELAAIVAASGRIVCGDTGMAHLATALRRPSVVLFGPIPPAAWGPPASRPWHRAIWCGRRGDPHGDTTDAGLLQITTAEVLDAIAGLPEPPVFPERPARPGGSPFPQPSGG